MYLAKRWGATILLCVTSCLVPLSVKAGDTGIKSAAVSHITEQFAISGQIQPDQLAELKARGFTTVIALRPDGEGADQPTAAQIEAAARAEGVSFAYIPVGSGPISESQVSALQSVIAGGTGKTLAFCRSGSRAARVWALAEASRPGGASAGEILAAVKAGGQSAENLKSEIDQRVGRRAYRP
jgi:uncharacterized protein (TIGR01244 family)